MKGPCPQAEDKQQPNSPPPMSVSTHKGEQPGLTWSVGNCEALLWIPRKTVKCRLGSKIGSC